MIAGMCLQTLQGIRRFLKGPDSAARKASGEVWAKSARKAGRQTLMEEGLYPSWEWSPKR